jgi:uncharacterized small protein (DUF1192 family)
MRVLVVARNEQRIAALRRERERAYSLPSM